MHASFLLHNFHACLFIGLLVLFHFILWVESGGPTEFEEPVENVYEEQSFYPTEEISGKMIISLDITTIFAY